MGGACFSWIHLRYEVWVLYGKKNYCWAGGILLFCYYKLFGLLNLQICYYMQPANMIHIPTTFDVLMVRLCFLACTAHTYNISIHCKLFIRSSSTCIISCYLVKRLQYKLYQILERNYYEAITFWNELFNHADN